MADDTDLEPTPGSEPLERTTNLHVKSTVKRPSDNQTAQRRNGPPNKRFKHANPKSRRGGVAYEKKHPQGGLLTSPTRPYFPVFVSTLGCESFVRIIYQWCVGADHRYGVAVPLPMLQHVTSLALYSRMLILKMQFGQGPDRTTSRLRDVAKSILLPDAICKMVEAIGKVDRAGLPTCIPYVPLWEEVAASDPQSQTYVNPADYLAEMGRLVPETPWCIDANVVTEYLCHCARGESRNLGFRVVNNDVLEGRTEMLYGYITHAGLEPGELIPAGPCQITQSEAELGAAYCFRNHDRAEAWLGRHNHLVRPDFIGMQFAVSTLTARLAGEHKRTGTGK